MGKSKTKRARVSKTKEPRPDLGLDDDDRKRLVTAIRQVWSWSHSRRLALKRAIGKGGFSYCEKCKKRAPKVFIDHINPTGEFDEKYISRMFRPSKEYQALCKACHQPKTNKENRARRKKKIDKPAWE